MASELLNRPAGDAALVRAEVAGLLLLPDSARSIVATAHDVHNAATSAAATLATATLTAAQARDASVAAVQPAAGALRRWRWWHRRDRHLRSDRDARRRATANGAHAGQGGQGGWLQPYVAEAIAVSIQAATVCIPGGHGGFALVADGARRADRISTGGLPPPSPPPLPSVRSIAPASDPPDRRRPTEPLPRSSSTSPLTSSYSSSFFSRRRSSMRQSAHVAINAPEAHPRAQGRLLGSGGQSSPLECQREASTTH